MIELTSKIKVVDNFFPLFVQKQLIKGFLLKHDLTYYYQPTISYDRKRDATFFDGWKKHNKVQDTDAFTYPIDDKFEGTPFIQQQLKHFAKIKFGINISKFLRIMVTYLPPNPQYLEDHHMAPHVDRETPHKNILYYINDNDADTLFYDYYYNKGEAWDFRKVNVIQKVKPVQGRAVFFDGHILHSASVSRLSKRITLNVNFLEEDSQNT